jgi:hemolysin activation/secretion protein
MTLVAQVSRKTISGTISADNRAFVDTGPYETLGVLDFNSFTEFGERTEVAYYHTFPNSQNFGQISEEFFIGSSGLKLKVYGGYGEVDPTGSLGQSGYHGTTTVFGTQLTYPLIRSRRQTLNVFGAFDGLESQITTGSPPTRASFDSLRVLRVGTEYVMSDIWLGSDHSAFNTASVRISQGLQILGASTTGTSATSPRQHERTDFTKINFELTRTQTLFSPWDGATVSLMGLVTGQWSNDILPPAEQFYLGGSRFTRGYYSGQVPGDKALAATVELQLNTAIPAAFIPDEGNIPAQFYIFYDWGETWQNQGADFATKIASAGGGARLQITKYAELDLEALGRFNVFPTGGQNTGLSALNGIGLYWRVLGRF